MPDPTDDLVTDETRAVEADEATERAGADREPTPDEERLAEANELDPDVADAYEEANERGANVKGEGQI